MRRRPGRAHDPLHRLSGKRPNPGDTFAEFAPITCTQAFVTMGGVIGRFVRRITVTAENNLHAMR